jgi:hypothetical protein
MHFSAPKAGLSGQKPIERTQKHVVLGVFGHFPKISKRPHAKNIINTAFSFENRSGETMPFEHVNFQPRASKAQNFYFLQNSPYQRIFFKVLLDPGGGGGFIEP